MIYVVQRVTVIYNDNSKFTYQERDIVKPYAHDLDTWRREQIKLLNSMLYGPKRVVRLLLTYEERDGRQ